MSNDFLFYKLGEVQLPVYAEDVPDGHLYQAFDPGRDKLLALFKTAINQELAHSTSSSPESTSSWYIARVGTPLADKMPVEDTLFEAPTPDILRETELSFPILCLYREESQNVDFTLARTAVRTSWGLDYILPPLGVDNLRRLGGALNAVKTIIELVSHVGYHPAYEGGVRQFGGDYGHFDKLAIESHKFGAASFGPDGEGTPYRMLQMKLVTIELSDVDPDLEGDLEAVDVAIGVGGFEGVKPNIIEASSDGYPIPNHGIPVPGQ